MTAEKNIVPVEGCKLLTKQELKQFKKMRKYMGIKTPLHVTNFTLGQKFKAVSEESYKEYQDLKDQFGHIAGQDSTSIWSNLNKNLHYILVFLVISIFCVIWIKL